MNKYREIEKFIIGIEIPYSIKTKLTVVDVEYLGFDNVIHQGQIVVNKKLEKDVKRIFNELLLIKFPINSIIPISKFSWSDYESCKANNTSCFNYRVIAGTCKLSEHAKGYAIDINPFQNPWVHPNAHKIEGREYNIKNKGTVTNEVVQIFKKYGWGWGGLWKNPDYQHFYKINSILYEIKSHILKLLSF